MTGDADSMPRVAFVHSGFNADRMAIAKQKAIARENPPNPHNSCTILISPEFEGFSLQFATESKTNTIMKHLILSILTLACFTIQLSAQVGIGTSSPQTDLDIRNDSNDVSLRLVPSDYEFTGFPISTGRATSRIDLLVDTFSRGGYQLETEGLIDLLNDTSWVFQIKHLDGEGSASKKFIISESEVAVGLNTTFHAGAATFSKDIQLFDVATILFPDFSAQQSAAGTKVFINTLQPAHSFVKSMQLPRSDTSSIFSPVGGLMLYDTLTQEFQAYDGSGWTRFGPDNDWIANGSDHYNVSSKFGMGTSVPSTFLHINQPGEASLTEHGLLQLGSTGNKNMVFDDNEIQARLNGAASPLYLNVAGGDLLFGATNLLQTFNIRNGNLALSYLGIGDTNRGIKFGDGALNDWGITYSKTTSPSSDKLHVRSYYYDQAGDDLLTFDGATGYIGKGTDSPESHFHISSTTDAGLATNGLLQLGPTNTENIVLDQNEMQARNNGAAEDLNFNVEGGDINFGNGGIDQEFEFRGGDVLMSSLGSSDLDRGIKWGEQNAQQVFGMIYDGEGSLGENRLHLRQYLNGTSDIMTYKVNGMVGIGQPDPQQLLHISKLDQIGAAPKLLFTNGQSGGTATDGFEIGMQPSVGGPPLFPVTNTARIWNYEDASLVFGTDNSERMRIQSDGQVGIGTGGPVDSKIHIHKASSGDIPAKIRFTDHVTGVGGPLSVAGFEVGLGINQEAVLLHRDNKDLVFYANNIDEVLRVKPSGDVRIKAHINDAFLRMQTATGTVGRVLQKQNDTEDVYVGDIDPRGGDVYIRANGADVMFLGQTGNVGIGLDNPGYRFQVGLNSAAKPLSSAWQLASDRRLKQDLGDFTDGLDVVMQMRPCRFRYNGQLRMPTDEIGIGTIAQELQQIAPYMIKPFTHTDEHGRSEEYLGVDYGAMDFVLVNAVQEQQEIITTQQEQIDELQEQMHLLQEQMRSLLSEADEK